MADEWEYLPLSEIVEIISGGTPKTSVREYWDGTIPWLAVSDFNTRHRWVSSAEKTITERGLEESATRILEPGDIIISARGTVGVVAQLSTPMAFNQSCYGIRGKQGIADTDFVYYALRHAVLKMRQFAHGSVFDTITRDTFSIIETNVPPLEEQKAISRILGTLDDKIELNRRMNETLESIARAIFKSWFVDFDPVRAKMEGRQPAGMNAEIAALFPDSFEESELGDIPKGWDTCKLSQLCTTQYGFTASATDEPVGPRFLRVKDMNKLDWIEWNDVPFCKIEGQNRQKYALITGDIVVARMADPGKVAIIDDDVDAVFASYLVRLKLNVLSHAYFMYYFLKSSIYKDYTTAARGGSVQANMNARIIVDVLMTNPSEELKEVFSGLVTPIRRRIASNVKQNTLLSSIRDTLLPKLISGEIRVKDAEKFVEEHAS